MNLKSNIGIINALFRITIGLTLLSWSTAKLAKKPRCTSYLWISFIGAKSVAEGIIRYCPLTDFIKNTYHYMKDNNNKPPLKQMIETFTTVEEKDDPSPKTNNDI